MTNLYLERPLVLFDLETTGCDPASDKIVEISTLKLVPGGPPESRTRRVCPERPIPPAATAVHGIRDEDVADEPTFRRLARGLLEFLGPADLGGFNVARFDLPLLDREFMDCGLDLEPAKRRIVDAMTIFHRKERRDLRAAVRFYLGRDHDGAHTAEADVRATGEVLEAQLERYPDLPRDVAGLDGWSRRAEDAVDRSGRLVRREGEIALAFGRFAGMPLRQVVAEQSEYVTWLLSTDLPADTRFWFVRARRGFSVDPGQSA